MTTALFLYSKGSENRNTPADDFIIASFYFNSVQKLLFFISLKITVPSTISGDAK